MAHSWFVDLHSRKRGLFTYIGWLFHTHTHTPTIIVHNTVICNPLRNYAYVSASSMDCCDGKRGGRSELRCDLHTYVHGLLFLALWQRREERSAWCCDRNSLWRCALQWKWQRAGWVIQHLPPPSVLSFARSGPAKLLLHCGSCSTKPGPILIDR